MARRAQSGIHPVWIVVIVVILAGAVGGGSLLMRGVNDPYRTLQALDIKTYLDNANSLRGNVYKIEGKISNSLAWSPTKGRLFSVEVGSGSETGVIAVLIPATLNQINVQKGQRFTFKIEIVQDGIILAQDMVKL
jgi:hypothetical protein